MDIAPMHNRHHDWVEIQLLLRGVPFEAKAVCEDSTDFGLVIPEGKLARFVSATDSEVSVAIGMLPTQAAL
jgi:hypothetical protein